MKSEKKSELNITNDISASKKQLYAGTNDAILRQYNK